MSTSDVNLQLMSTTYFKIHTVQSTKYEFSHMCKKTQFKVPKYQSTKALSIEYQSIKYQVSSIKYQVSSIKYQISSVKYQVLCSGKPLLIQFPRPEKSNSNHVNKNGRIIRPKGICFRNILGLFIWRVLRHVFETKIFFFSSFHLDLSSFSLSFSLSSSVFFFILSLLFSFIFSLSLLHLVSYLALLLLSSCLLSSLFSCLVPPLSSSLVSSSLSPSLSSFSVSLCLCLRVMLCVVLCGVCRCGRGVCLCVAAR